MEAVTDFIFLDSKIFADGDCSHAIKGCLPLGRKVMTNLDSVSKRQRHHFANKGLYSQSYGFSSSQKRWGFPDGCNSPGKNPPAMQESQEIHIRSLCLEYHVEESMATHSSILAWRIS